MDVKIVKYFLSGVLISGTGGCAITPPSGLESLTSVERLAPRDLPPGDCGLFVWSGDAARQFILFSQAATSSGAWLKEGKEVSLTITTQDGEVANRQFPNVTYSTHRDSDDADGVVELSLKDRETIINGTRFKGGTLRITDDTGWETVKPVVGLTACQPT